uniref:NADH-ubiquinone oxidoreductase chain 5 n=1 Tax=Nymphon unguiculatum-charcoti complex sp. SEM-1997 TaxID=61899 RepID=E0XLH3_9CHEL|nr:NADH dehydrogenase subunit 5 [Nymphon unguiculatum-charcoti complex sp. SEM-1997]
MMIFYIFSFFLFLLSLLQMLFFMMFLYYDLSYIFEVEMMALNCVFPNMSFIMDIYSLSFSSFVTMISSSVFLFSTIYMKGEKYLIRFFSLMAMFVLSMILLIFSANIITSLLGWDGLGFVSYILVVYYPNKFSLSGGLMTIMTNRLGDSFMLISVATLMSINSWDTAEMKMSIFMLILASMTKSAQFPFSAWLPAAMAAPTPVSSLVHSSTLVTAGVYVLFRFSPNIMSSPESEFLLICSIFTMMLAGICAFFEYDLKKIIALSTLSQLGVMMFSLAIGLKLLAFFHLIVHAFFKALMFLSGGSLMYNYSGAQDIRFMGSMNLSNPYTNSCLIFSSLCLGAFPFLASFYSKHLILDYFLFKNYNMFLLLMVYTSNMLTLFYSIRLIKFLSSRFMNLSSLMNINENYKIFISLSILVILSLLGSYLLFSYYFMYPQFITNAYLEKLMMNVLIPISMLSALLILKSIYPFMNWKKNFMKWFFGNMWFISYFSGQYMSYITKYFSNLYINNLEYGLSEFYGPQGLGAFFMKMGKTLNFKQFKLMEFYHMNFLFWMMFIPLI